MTCGRQMNQDNIPAESVSDYFKKVLTIPLANHLHSELKSKFDTTSTNTYYGLYITLKIGLDRASIVGKLKPTAAILKRPPKEYK